MILDADEATLTGDWELTNSQVAPEEGAVVYPNQENADGYAQFEINVECAGEWHVWVRGLDDGTDDSFLVNVSGVGGNAATFDLDCGLFDNEPRYVWEHLNRRANFNTCGQDNPWVLTRDVGSLAVRFSEREMGAISEVQFTNDASYDPSAP